MHSRLRSIFLVLIVSAVTALAVQTTPSPTPPPAAVISPDNVKSFDPAAATAAWLATVPADKRAKSDAYFEGGYWLLLWDFLLGVAIAIFLLQTRISARLRDLAERFTDFKTMQVVIYAIPMIIIFAVLSFPLAVYEKYFREHKYDLATQTFGPWFVEQLEGLIIALIAFSVTLAILYAVFRRAPRTWWIWGTVVMVVLQMFGSLINPVYVEPIFNSYKPLEDPAVRDPILALASANQIPVHQVFVVDASRQTTRISANVAGFLGTTRIALNDNLLKQCTLPEIRHVMGHEMGHYVLNHITKLITLSAVQFLFVFALTARLFAAAASRWGERWGVRGMSDPAGLPLLVLILSPLFFLLTPLQNTITRITEREADAFGLNTAREPDGMAEASLKLATYRKLNPTPWEEIIFFDHPSGRSRIRMAMDWKAAHLPDGDVR